MTPIFKMRLLKATHQAAFRIATDIAWPGVGWLRKVGSGAGVFTFLSIDDAGHCEYPSLIAI